MPTIAATAFPTLGRTYVEINWSDTPSAHCAQVIRTVTSTGETAALRPYIYPCPEAGEYIRLSDGLGVFWDNEAPLDVPVSYTTVAINIAGGSITGTSITGVTLASNDGFWLRDPLRPCHDVLVGLCWSNADPACDPAGGVAFVALDAETYEANSSMFMPTNAKYPVPITRQRRAPATTITFLTKLFTDRDAVLELLDPGSPILFSAPPAYGIPDRYMHIGPVTVSRMKVDHRKQLRVIQLPYNTVARQPGTQQGTCEAQIDNLCSVYATWDAMEAASVTWVGIMEGDAGA